MMILDASALIELLLQTDKAPRIAHRLAAYKFVHAPHLIDLEVASTLRRQYTAKKLLADRAEAALQGLQAFPLIRYSHEMLMKRVWELRFRFTCYDASYVALAEMLNGSLITCDAKLREAGGFVEAF